MFDDLEALFVESVLTAYREFTQSTSSDTAGHSNDLRLAVNAATALYHLREHIPATKRKTRRELATKCPDYDLLGDIVNAAKHKSLSRGTPQVASADDLCEEIFVTEYEDADGPYRVAEKAVTVQLRNGSWRDVREVLTAVLNMWIDEFKAMGLLKFLEPSQTVNAVIPQRKSPTSAAPISLSAYQGLRFGTRYRFQKYNYSTGQIEAVDMTNASLALGIYEPAYVLELVMADKTTGERIRRTVKLSLEERDEFLGLQNDAQRLEFVQRVGERCSRALNP